MFGNGFYTPGVNLCESDPSFEKQSHIGESWRLPMSV